MRVDHSGGEPVISEVMPRRNFLVRPAVANVDIAVIVVAPQPEIDYYLIDKMIINCKRVGIECAICLNKSDLADGELEILDAQFSKDVAAVVSVSALSGDIGNLLPLLKDKLVCFAGQSAVGKSTISNGILGGAVRAVGSLSDRIGRGRNTTTSAEILKSDKGFSFIDTPGFSMLDLFEEDYGSLAAILRRIRRAVGLLQISSLHSYGRAGLRGKTGGRKRYAQPGSVLIVTSEFSRRM